MKKILTLIAVLVTIYVHAQPRRYSYITTKTKIADYYENSEGGYTTYNDSPFLDIVTVWDFTMYPESESGVIQIRDGQTFIITDYFVSETTKESHIGYIGYRKSDESKVIIIIIELYGRPNIALYTQASLKAIFSY